MGYWYVDPESYYLFLITIPLQPPGKTVSVKEILDRAKTVVANPKPNEIFRFEFIQGDQLCGIQFQNYQCLDARPSFKGGEIKWIAAGGAIVSWKKKGTGLVS